MSLKKEEALPSKSKAHGNINQFFTKTLPASLSMDP
jgi:hypothetical protein